MIVRRKKTARVPQSVALRLCYSAKDFKTLSSDYFMRSVPNKKRTEEKRSIDRF